MGQPGRPTKYEGKKTDEQVYKLCLLGCTDVEIADIIGVSEDTIHEWKKVHPSFSESIKSGKEVADADVAEKLLMKAKGYDVVEERLVFEDGRHIIKKVKKHIPADTRAQEIWLRNRRRKSWKDQKDVNLKDNRGLDNQLMAGRQKVQEKLKESKAAISPDN